MANVNELENVNKCFCTLNKLVEFTGTIIPQRVVMGLFGFFAIAVAYTIRACLSVAIVEMVVPVEHAGTGNHARTAVSEN